MKFDVTIAPDDLNSVPDLARSIEQMGFAGIWTTETSHNPFLPLTLAASTTKRIELGTAIAVAFPRSPMVTAYAAWDLAAQSNGQTAFQQRMGASCSASARVYSCTQGNLECLAA